MVLCSSSNGMCTRIEPGSHPDFPFLKKIGQMTLSLLIVSGKPGMKMPLNFPELGACLQNGWACSSPDVYLARSLSVMKPGPVAEHLGRPPSRVPLCLDSGPLWSGGAGLKVELLETLPSPCLQWPSPAATDHSESGWPLF